MFWRPVTDSGSVDISIFGKKDLNVGYLDQFPEHLILLKTTNELVTELKENQIFDSSVIELLKETQSFWNTVGSRI